MIGFIKKNKVDILIILLFLFLPFIFFKEAFHLNSIIQGSGDTTGYNMPFQYLTSSILKDGGFPFWNKYIYSGVPLLANPQAGVLYPITLLFGLIFPFVVSFNLSLLLHYSLAGIFIYLFLGEYKLDKIARFSAGLVFMFSGVMITHRSHPGMIHTIIWLPLILLLLERFRKSRKLEYVLAASIVYAVSFFASHPQMFLYSSIIILLFIIYYTFTYKKVNLYFLLSGLIFIFGFLIMVIQLFPNYELSSISARAGLDYYYFSSFSFDPRLIPVLFFPYIYGNSFYSSQDIPPYFGPWNSTEMIIYFGLVGISFLIFSVFVKNKHKYLWLFILALSFLLVLGVHTPFYKIMHYIPLYNKFRVPARNWYEFGFAFSILVGFGFDYFIKLKKKNTKKIIIIILSLFSVVFSSYFVLKIFLNIDNSNRIISFLRLSGENLKFFMISLSITNYFIFIPLILMAAIISIFVVLLFKKNKVLYFLLILIIFCDLFYFTFFNKGNSDIEYLSSRIENTENLDFLNNEKEIFRILPLTSNLSGIILSRNKNIHHDLESIAGYEPVFLKNYNYFTGIYQSVARTTNWKELLDNNNIISMLNTKYIIMKKPVDVDKYLIDLQKIYGDIDKSVFIEEQSIRSEYLNAKKISDNSYMIYGRKSEPKMLKIPITINSNTDYFVSFKIRKNEELDNLIYFDLFGNNYDHAEQEFSLSQDDIKNDFILIKRIVNSGDVPNDTDIFFRVFTNSGGEVEIDNLIVSEAITYDNYELIYDKNEVIVLENKKVLPRFRFVKDIKGINEISEIRDILWERDIIYEKDRFDISKTVIVENLDFPERRFEVQDPEIKINKYKNNEINITTFNKDDGFLVFSGTYFPGWKTFIDGAETTIYVTNGIMQGIYVPEGEHEIVFKYLPSNFIIYFVVSATSLIIIIMGIVLLHFKRRRKIRK